MKAKASDIVRKSQIYPKTRLRFEYFSFNMWFEKLDINLLVATEIEIISDKCIKDNDLKGRLELLKKIMYSSNSYEFAGLESYNAAVLIEIKLETNLWKMILSLLGRQYRQKMSLNQNYGVQN